MDSLILRSNTESENHVFRSWFVCMCVCMYVCYQNNSKTSNSRKSKMSVLDPYPMEMLFRYIGI